MRACVRVRVHCELQRLSLAFNEGREPREGFNSLHVCLAGDSPAQSMSPSPPPEPGLSQLNPAPSEDKYDEEEEDISPDLWQEACWIVIRWVDLNFQIMPSLLYAYIYTYPRLRAYAHAVHTLMRKDWYVSSWTRLTSSSRCLSSGLWRTHPPLRCRLRPSTTTLSHRSVERREGDRV